MNSTKPAPTAAKREPTLPKRADATDPVVDGLKDLNIGQRTPSLVVNGTGSSFTERSKSLTKDGSDDSQRADSSSELGTKPPSLDGKSITSGTTFALDEKESLRPDDSASVKAAAAEDDDSFSFRGPNLPSSRMGSDIAARARGIIQLGDMPDRRLAQPISGSLSQGMITPQSASSDQPPMPSANALSATLPDSANLLNTIYGQAPDEKLLEAMASPKDRLFLLRLEAELIKFVQNSKVPESLASIAAPETNSETPPPPAVLPRKIMRRGEEGEFGTNSASPSKPTSETGSDSKDKSGGANQKLSREQREEAYKQARERIFGNSEKTGESTPVQQQPYPNQIQAPYNTTPTQTFAPMIPNTSYNAAYPNMPPRQELWGIWTWTWTCSSTARLAARIRTGAGTDDPSLHGQCNRLYPASTVPYMYGQLPANVNPNDPKSQHPIPGSYNRHAFNPKTQSFVPGGGMAPMQPPQPPFSAPGSHHGSPQIGSPHLAYAGYQQPGPPAPYGYGMVRQGSNNSIPSYHPPPPQHPHHLNPLPQAPGSHIPQHPPQHLPQNPSPHIPNKPAIPQGPAGQTFSHLPHYGNPATLPQKPNMGV
ncbi:R3H domain-containing protein [Colletotrichum tofieldiae]|nr:R3H domain-containing protein [Colletotrichum tofieldiae]